MSSKTKTLPNPLRSLRRRINKRSKPDSRRRLHWRHLAALRAPNPINNGDTTSSSSPCSSSDVSAKLDALRSLIPAQSTAALGKAHQTDQLFKETADYIVLLKTQVVILQKLVDFFGSACCDTENSVIS